MDLSIRLEVFEGPLDLLLHLLEKNKVSIYDIPIVEITNQYMEYIREMQRQDLNVMSEFLVMAATLLDIKSRWLLPKEVDENEEEIDPRDELVQQLLQYKMYKYMSLELKDRQLDAGLRMYKEATIPDEVRKYEPPVDLAELTKGYDLQRLHQIFEDVLKRQEEKIDPVRSNFGKIEKEAVSLDDKLASIRTYAKSHSRFSFRSLLEKQKSRGELIVTFLAVLEYVKIGLFAVEQEQPFGDMDITVQDVDESVFSQLDESSIAD